MLGGKWSEQGTCAAHTHTDTYHPHILKVHIIKCVHIHTRHTEIAQSSPENGEYSALPSECLFL